MRGGGEELTIQIHFRRITSFKGTAVVTDGPYSGELKIIQADDGANISGTNSEFGASGGWDLTNYTCEITNITFRLEPLHQKPFEFKDLNPAGAYMMERSASEATQAPGSIKSTLLSLVNTPYKRHQGDPGTEYPYMIVYGKQSQLLCFRFVNYATDHLKLTRFMNEPEPDDDDTL